MFECGLCRSCVNKKIIPTLFCILSMVGCGSDDTPGSSDKAAVQIAAGSVSVKDVIADERSQAAASITYDPCRLVTLKEAEEILGGPVVVDQKTPQAQFDNHCNYKSKNNYQNQITVTVNNSRGYTPGARLENDISRGKAAVEGIGDIATVFHSSAGFSAIEFADKNVGVGLTVSGISDREQRVGKLASQASERIHSGEGLFQVPGIEALVGNWLVTMNASDVESYLNIKEVGNRGDVMSIVTVERDGDYKGIARLKFFGRLEFDGSDWYSLDSGANKRAKHGEMEVEGDEMQLDGDIEMALVRVPCKQPPALIKEDTELVKPLIGWSVWNGNTDLAPPDGFVGLWEGKGEVFGQDAQVLFAIGDNSEFILLVFLDQDGKLEAGNGNFTLEIENQKIEKGQYEFAGGIQQGSINLMGQYGTQTWLPYSPGQFNDKIDRPLLGYCQNQPRKKFQ